MAHQIPNTMAAVWSFLLLFLLVVTSTTASRDKEEALLEWVREQGGYFNPKQEFGYDENGLFGVFAIEAIQKNEILASFPWSCIIASDYYGPFDSCELVARVAQEMHRNQSIYGSTLFDTAKRNENLLPTYWSKEGQELFLKVTGNGILPPEDPFLTEFEWKNECEWIGKAATQLVMTHSEISGMVPLTDKYISRGGNWTGAYYSLENGEELGLEIRAFRMIKKGEQMYTNYKDPGVGTPEMLRDYGFIEQYPQRYFFHSINVAFEVEETKDGGLQVRWHKDLRVATKPALPFLRKQLLRLKRVYFHLQRDAEDSDKSIPERELEVILRFCQDYITALSLAVTSASKILGWTNTLQS